MREVVLFGEDFGHEAVIEPLIRRFGDELDVPLDVRVLTSVGGHPRMLSELRQFAGEVERGLRTRPDLIVVARDANCKGYTTRRDEVMGTVGEALGSMTVPAIPDPHVERWLLLDSAAFRAALGTGCAAPDEKCERGRYKALLNQAVRETGRIPLLGGLEHAQDLIASMDLDRMTTADDSLGRFITELRQRFGMWRRGER